MPSIEVHSSTINWGDRGENQDPEGGKTTITYKVKIEGNSYDITVAYKPGDLEGRVPNIDDLVKGIFQEAEDVLDMVGSKISVPIGDVESEPFIETGGNRKRVSELGDDSKLRNIATRVVNLFHQFKTEDKENQPTRERSGAISERRKAPAPRTRRRAIKAKPNYPPPEAPTTASLTVTASRSETTKTREERKAEFHEKISFMLKRSKYLNKEILTYLKNNRDLISQTTLDQLMESTKDTEDLVHKKTGIAQKIPKILRSPNKLTRANFKLNREKNVQKVLDYLEELIEREEVCFRDNILPDLKTQYNNRLTHFSNDVLKPQLDSSKQVKIFKKKKEKFQNIANEVLSTETTFRDLLIRFKESGVLEKMKTDGIISEEDYQVFIEGIDEIVASASSLIDSLNTILSIKNVDEKGEALKKLFLSADFQKHCKNLISYTFKLEILHRITSRLTKENYPIEMPPPQDVQFIDNFYMLPFQRLQKYPLLFGQIQGVSESGFEGIAEYMSNIVIKVDATNSMFPL